MLAAGRVSDDEGEPCTAAAHALSLRLRSYPQDPSPVLTHKNKIKPRRQAKQISKTKKLEEQAKRQSLDSRVQAGQQRRDEILQQKKLSAAAEMNKALQISEVRWQR